MQLVRLVLQEYEFGYKKNGVRVVTWRYRVDGSEDADYSVPASNLSWRMT
jgi:hypothetical protein